MPLSFFFRGVFSFVMFFFYGILSFMVFFLLCSLSVVFSFICVLSFVFFHLCSFICVVVLFSSCCMHACISGVSTLNKSIRAFFCANAILI